MPVGLALAVLLGGCHGRPGGSLPSAGGSLAVRLVIPAVAAAAARRGHFIAPSVRSLTVAVNGGSAIAFDLGPAAPGCAAASAGLMCAFSVAAPPGPDAIAVVLYDGAGGAGNLLGQAGANAVVAPGAVSSVGITVGGVVAAVRLQLALPAPVIGTVADIPLAVTALDADGNVIVADPFAVALDLTDSDGSGATGLSTTTVVAPTQTVSVHYTGAAVGRATFSAVLRDGGSVAVTAAALTPKRADEVDWAAFAFDAQRTGYNPGETACCRSAPSLRWTHQMPAAYLTAQPLLAANVFTPLVAGGAYVDLVYAADNHGDLVALDADDGSVVWSRTLGAQHTGCADIPDQVFGITGTPLFDRGGNRLYVVDGTGHLWALDPGTGQLASGWPAAGLPVVGNPALDHVYGAVNLDPRRGIMPIATASYCDTGLWDGALRFVDVSAASVVGTFTFATAPAWGGGIWGMGGASIDAGSGDVFGASGNIEPSQTLPYSDAVARWTAGTWQVAATYRAAATVADDDFGATPSLFPAPDGRLCASVENKGGMLYTFDAAAIGAGPTTTIALGTATYYANNTTAPSYSPPNGRIYVTTGLSRVGFPAGLYAFDVRAGCTLPAQPAWVAPSGTNGIFSPTTVADGVVFVAQGSTVHGYDAATGAELWSVSASTSAVYAGIAVADGMMITAGWDGTVRAFAPSGPLPTGHGRRAL